MQFVKMHGIGNDYVFVVGMGDTISDPRQLARKIVHPHYGIGGDGLVLVDKGTDTDFVMRIFNKDGSEAEMCGNAARCVGKLVYERGLTKKTNLTLRTGAGIRQLTLYVTGDQVDSVSVRMGQPILEASAIPCVTDSRPPVAYPLEIDGETVHLTCVSMGNPHAVIFVDDPNQAPVERIGAKIEHHSMFPNRTNVEFVQVVDAAHLRLRVWERGSGETMACGTGACAALVAAVLHEKCGRKAEVTLPGGTLTVQWDQDTGEVIQSGPAAYIASGEYLA